MLLRLLRGGWPALFFLCWCGCPRPPESQADELKNPHYLAGKERLSSLDYRGAIESFVRATEDNPRSALAHFELAVLYETRENDYVSALYHYNKALKLRPDSYPADNVRQRIPGCRQELVKTDSLNIMNPTMLRDTERLREENQTLRRQVAALQAQLAGRPVALTNPSAGSGSTPTGTVRGGTAPPSGTGTTSARPSGSGPTRGTSLPPTARPRTHAVKQGETLTAVARSYGVRLDALLAANPGLDARKLKVGQPLNLPAP